MAIYVFFLAAANGNRNNQLLLIDLNLCYSKRKGGDPINMEQENIFLALRTAKGISQEELAEKVFVTRQAVSRWERGRDTPRSGNIEAVVPAL